MKKNKIFWLVFVLMPLVLITACDTRSRISETAAFFGEMSRAEPLLINPDLAGLVSMEVRQVTYEGSGIWILDISFENNSEYLLICGSLTDGLEFFDGKYWRRVPNFAPRESYAVTIFPRGGFAIIFDPNDRDEFGRMAYVSSGTWPDDYDEIMAEAVPWDLGIGYLFERNGTQYLFSPRARPETIYKSWQFTIRLNPQFFGLDGPMGEPLTELPFGNYRLRHRLWPDTYWWGDEHIISDVPHEVIAEFQLR